MAWASLLPLLLTYCSGIGSQPTLTQIPFQSVTLGNTVRLTTTLSSAHARYVVSWYQQREDQAPRLVVDTSNNRGSGIPDRFSGSSSGSERYLTITNVLAEDEATYYCGADHGSDASFTFVFGVGTHLDVTGQPVVPPSVSLFPPSQEELKSKNKATLACLMDGFHPGVVQVEWLGDGRTISSGVETTKPVKQGDKYIASSYLTLTRSEWEANGSYTCKVTHESKIIEKVVSRSSCS